MYKWFLAQRYLYTKIVVVFPIIAVTLCVAMMLVVISIMDGFLDMVKERSRGLLSDVIVDVSTFQGFPYYGEFEQYVQDQLPDDIKHITPVIYNYGMLREPRTKYTKPVRVLGIRLNDYKSINTFGDGLHYNTYYPGTTNLDAQKKPVFGFNGNGEAVLPDEFYKANAMWRETATDEEIKKYDRRPFDQKNAERLFFASPDGPGYEGQDKHGIIIGADVIHDRGPSGEYHRVFPKGMDMTLGLFTMTSSGTMVGGNSANMTTLPVRYTDDSRTGVFEIDSLCVYVDFDWLQYSIMMDQQEREDGSVIPARCTQLLISLKDGVDVNEGSARISDAWRSFRATLNVDPFSTEYQLLDRVMVETWEERQRPFISAVEKEKVLMTILMWLISGVAIVLVGVVFFMIVEKKTRDIGILKSIGASASGVAMIFIVYAAAVGIIGSILGSVGGACFVHYINDIQDLLASFNPNLRVWSPDVYSFDQIPNRVKSHVVLTVISVAITSSIIGALIPAIMAGRVWPARTLRYE